MHEVFHTNQCKEFVYKLVGGEPSSAEHCRRAACNPASRVDRPDHGGERCPSCNELPNHTGRKGQYGHLLGIGCRDNNGDPGLTTRPVPTRRKMQSNQNFLESPMTVARNHSERTGWFAGQVSSWISRRASHICSQNSSVTAQKWCTHDQPK